ncbi:MAG TPA: condensation domain-containing protein, partial [Pseudonocardiaceae bacterium]
MAELLPRHLRPSAYVRLDALPLTPNGKLDRAALPEPELATAEHGQPRTAREQILCLLVADVLGLPSDRVSPDDNFFDLGGHSLLAAKLAGRVHTALGTRLRIQDVFGASSVGELAARVGPSVDRPPLTARQRPDRIPLSPAQARLWFLAQADADRGAYTVANTLALPADIDVPALRAALNDLVDRHESLRTVFPVAEGTPYQLVLPASRNVDLPVVAVLAHDRDGAVRDRVDVPFDLVADLPIRATLLRTDDEYLLVLVLHHIASDGWSMSKLVGDLAAAYTARAAGEAPQWTPLPVQYADYTLWQRDVPGAAEQLDFWRTALAGAPDRIDLPIDRPRPAEPTHRSGTLSVHLPSELHAALAALARQHGSTLFMVLHAALAALLTRLGGGTDITIGTGVAGRTDPALDDLVGFFVNTVVLRTDTAGDPTFRELLHRVRAADLAAMDNADVPFDRVVEELNPVRAGHHPLFQTMLMLQTNDVAEITAGDITWAARPVQNTVAKFDLTFTLAASEDGLHGHLEFDTDLFDTATAACLIDRYTLLLTACAADPDRRLGALPVMAERERQQLLVDWNGGDPAPIDRCVHELIADQAVRTPDAVALVHGDMRVTYAQLDNHANVLARELLAAGVVPGDVVGIHLDRDPNLVVAVLGALKVGACYTMLDPSFPAERLDLLVRVASPRVVVDSVPAMPVEPVAAPVVSVSPADSACLMFTSGSTGRPKGVLAPHRAVVATLMGQDFVDFSGVWLQCSPLSWDAFAL